MLNRETIDQRLSSLLANTQKYLVKAVQAREMFYQGMDESAADALRKGERPVDHKYAFGKSQQGTQLVNDNKWHMSQSRTFGIAAVARGVYLLVHEQRRTNRLLEEQILLQKETRDALRRLGNSGQ